MILFYSICRNEKSINFIYKIYLETIATRGYWDERIYSIEEIESEIKKINELLLSAGVNQTEINKVIKEVIDDSPLKGKIQISN